MVTSMNKPTLPRREGYRINSIVQYSRQKEHFRTIKFIGNKVMIIDGAETTYKQNLTLE